MHVYAHPCISVPVSYATLRFETIWTPPAQTCHALTSSFGCFAQPCSELGVDVLLFVPRSSWSRTPLVRRCQERQEIQRWPLGDPQWIPYIMIINLRRNHW